MNRGTVGRLLARAAASHPVRAWKQYSERRGGLLAGGMAFVGLFSIGASLVVGFTVLGALVGRDSALRDEVVRSVDEQLPGLLDLGPDGGLVPPRELFAEDVLSLTGLVALLVALVMGLRWLDGARQGIRAVFGCERDETFIVRKKVKDLGVMATLGLTVLASAVLGLAVSAAAGWLLRLVGLEGSAAGAAVLRVLTVLVVLAVDTLVFMVLFRLLAGLQLPWARLRAGALAGALGLGVLKLAGGLLLSRAGGANPLLAGSAVLAGLLVWMNLVSRVTLLAAAWTATADDVDPAAALQGDVERGAREEPGGPADGASGEDGLPPGAVSAGGPGARRVPLGPRDVLTPSFGQHARDRTTLLAGAVLGGLALTGFRAVAEAARSVRDGFRSAPD